MIIYAHRTSKIDNWFIKEVNEISKITNKSEIRCESRYGQHKLSMKIMIQFDEPYVKTYTSKVQKSIENIDQLGVW